MRSGIEQGSKDQYFWCTSELINTCPQYIGKRCATLEKATSNYAFKPIAEQALGSNQTIVPQRLNAALGLITVTIANMSMYREIIDQLVNETRTNSAYSKRASENQPFPVESEQFEFNELLISLTTEQRVLLSKVLLQERNSSIHDVLAVLSWWVECRSVGLSLNGQLMPVGLSGMGMHGDYVGRVDNWAWPGNKA